MVQRLVTTALDGSVITQLTAPVDCVAPAIPVTVVVKVTGRFTAALALAAKVMIGVCFAKVKLRVLLEAAR